MPWFSLHRSHSMATTTGHIIEFKKGEATWVPDVCVPMAVAIGAIPTVPLDAALDPIPAAPIPTVSLTPEERQTKLFEAFDSIIGRNRRDDFLASGMPHIKKIEDLVDFQVSAVERDETWQKYNDAKTAKANA
jgi:hypothetical protein